MPPNDEPTPALIDRLRDSGAALPPSHVPSSGEALNVLGALIAWAEFGDRFFAAVAAEDATAAVDALFMPPEAVQAAPAAPVAPDVPAPAAPEAPAPATDELAQLRAENAQLGQQLQAALAQLQRTQVGEPAAPGPGDVPTQGPAV